MNRRHALQTAAASVFLPLISNAQASPPAERTVTLPPGITAFENYHCALTNDAGQTAYAALTKAGSAGGVVVWSDTGLYVEYPGNADYGAPWLRWGADGSLIVSSVSQGGRAIWEAVVQGFRKAP